MLTEKQKEDIRLTYLNEMYFYEKKGVPIDENRKKVSIPDFLELRNQALEALQLKGFYNITFASPNKANCIIRVYKKVHFPFILCTGQLHNLWGFNCFVKESINGDDIWTSLSEEIGGHTKFSIDFSRHVLQKWFMQDELVCYTCDFFDTYIVIQ